MPLVQSELSLQEIESIFPAITPLLRDDGVTEIMVVSNTDGVQTFYEKAGALHQQSMVGVTLRDLESFCFAVARPLGLDPDTMPLMDARLSDGSRVALCVSPATPFPALTIRRFGKRQFTGADLVKMGALPQLVLDRLSLALSGSGNVLVAGGTGSGKTTLLNALIRLFPDDDRILVVEDTLELHVTQPNTVRLEARDLGAFDLSARDMVKHALRHRPDHIVIGEIRGEEAQDVLQALNTGHGGSLTTIHANTAHDALTRLACCAKQASDDYPWEIICQLVSMAFSLVVHQCRLPGGGRGVSELVEVGTYDRTKAEFRTTSVWKRQTAAADGAASSTQDRPPKAVATMRGGTQVASPVGAPPRPVDIADRATVAPPARVGDASAMIISAWPRRRVKRLTDVPQGTGQLPVGRPMRFVVKRRGWAVPREFVLERGLRSAVSPDSVAVVEETSGVSSPS